MFAEVAENKDEYNMCDEQSGRCAKQSPEILSTTTFVFIRTRENRHKFCSPSPTLSSRRAKIAGRCVPIPRPPLAESEWGWVFVYVCPRPPLAESEWE